MLTQSEEEILDRIERTFAGVTLGEGIGMYEAYAIDGGGINRRWERERDEREDWHLLLQNRDFMEWQSRSQYSFMDALGFRFALPAEMIRSFQTGEYLFVWHLDVRGKDMSLWAELDGDQLACVAAFVRISAELDERDPPPPPWTSDWRGIYEHHWRRYDLDPDGSVR